MASVVVAAGTLKPEIRLAQAISEFEAALTEKQKSAFRAERARTSKSNPTPQDVMRLTAEIDTKASKGRCFGPRFTNVINAVQKFASVGDIVVGGSQNLIACGVWSVVRIGLMAIPNTASTLDKISALFMTIGRTAPRHDQLAALYPRSHKLHDQLSEYYIVMVKLCQSVIKSSNKSTLGQLISSLNESELVAFQSSLEQHASSIKSEVQLLIAQRIESESAASSKFRELSHYFSSTAARNLRLQKRARILAACTTYDHEKSWKQIRKLGNATLHENHAAFLKWRDSSKPETLIINGKLGSGKSVLMANIVDNLCLYHQGSSVIVTYFFCRWNEMESLKTETIMGSLLRQIVNTLDDSTAVEKAFAKVLNHTITNLSEDDLVTMLEQLIPRDKTCYFVLDGLGECPEDVSAGTQRLLAKIRIHPSFRLCISKRIEAENYIDDLVGLKLTIPNTNNLDVKNFIGSELERCIADGSLILGDPSLIIEIHDALITGADGMMLWVALQIKALCQRRTDAALRKALLDLPKSLSETFARILMVYKDDEHTTYRHKLFTLIMISVRPLSHDELRVAMSVEPGNLNWNQSQLINNISPVMLACGGLLVTDEDDHGVHFVHPSFKQHLITETDGNFGEFYLHQKMADILVTYLNYSIFEQRLVRRDGQVNAANIPSSIVQHTFPAGPGRDVALRILKSKRIGNFDMMKTLACINTNSTVMSSLHDYAKTYLRHHAWTYIVETSDGLFKLLVRCLPTSLKPYPPPKRFRWDSDVGFGYLVVLSIEEPYTIFGALALRQEGNFWKSRLMDSDGHDPCDWALRLGHVGILNRMLSNIKGRELERDQLYLYSVHLALMKNFLEAADQMLLRSKGDLDLPLAACGGKPLLRMAVLDYYPSRSAVVDLLVRRNASPNKETATAPTPFFLALSMEYWDMAEQFFETIRGPDYEYELYRLLFEFCTLIGTDVKTPLIGREKQITWLIQHGFLALAIEYKRYPILQHSNDFHPSLVETFWCAGVLEDDEFWNNSWGAKSLFEAFKRNEYNHATPAKWQYLPDFGRYHALQVTRDAIDNVHKREAAEARKAEARARRKPALFRRA